MHDYFVFIESRSLQLGDYQNPYLHRTSRSSASCTSKGFKRFGGYHRHDDNDCSADGSSVAAHALVYAS